MPGIALIIHTNNFDNSQSHSFKLVEDVNSFSLSSRIWVETGWRDDDWCGRSHFQKMHPSTDKTNTTGAKSGHA